MDPTILQMSHQRFKRRSRPAPEPSGLGCARLVDPIELATTHGLDPRTIALRQVRTGTDVIDEDTLADQLELMLMEGYSR